MIAPPRDLDELLARARALRDRSLASLAAELGLPNVTGLHAKGKPGELIERALGATGGSARVHDFPELGVELKTIPVGADLKPRESTFVCAISLEEAERVEWLTSWARAKLSCVLFVPIVTEPEPTIATPLLWRPTEEQDAILAADFDEAMGQIAIGGIEGLTAHAGRWLQVRPKAADGRARATTWGGDEGERVSTVPRGFYLRARFTGALLRDAAACP